jgi:hypothetical protein
VLAAARFNQRSYQRVTLSLAKSLASLLVQSRAAILVRLTDRQAAVVAESEDQDIARQMSRALP